MPSERARKEKGRTKSIAKRFEPHQQDEGSTSTITTGRADEAAAIIENTPIPIKNLEKQIPSIPRRPPQSDQTLPSPPPSPQEKRDIQRDPPPARMNRPPTPIESAASMSTTSLQTLQHRLNDVDNEIRGLKTQLFQRGEDISDLRKLLKEAIERYDEAIADVRKAQEEKDVLRDEVQRLRSELREERRGREELEGEIDRKRGRERELLEVMDRARGEERERMRGFVEEVKAVGKGEESTPRGKAKVEKVEKPHRRGPEAVSDVRSYPFTSSYFGKPEKEKRK